jgi:hypothetical protein
LSPDGALIIGLRELNGSGFTGIAFLAPGADGASTDVSTFIAPTQDEGRGRGGGAEETTADDEAALPTADATPGADEDEAEGDMTIGTPEANQ